MTRQFALSAHFKEYIMSRLLIDALYASSYQIDGVSNDDVARLRKGIGTAKVSTIQAMDQASLVAFLMVNFGTTLEGELNEIAKNLAKFLQPVLRDIRRGNKLTTIDGSRGPTVIGDNARVNFDFR